MTATPHQPAPENVSKAAIDHLGLRIFCQMSMEEELESGDQEASAIFRDLYRCVDIAESAERLNAQKDALIVELRADLKDALWHYGQNIQRQKDDKHNTVAQDKDLASKKQRLVKTADSYAGKVVLDAEAVAGVRRAIERSRDGWDVLARSDEGTGGMEDEVVRLTRALALLDAPTANPENGKDGK